MPRTYKRHCNHCGRYYEGYGAKYCSPDCVGAANSERAGNEPVLPEAPDNEVQDEVLSNGDRVVRVMASDTIRTAEELLEVAGVDDSEWETLHRKVKKWDVAMKLRVKVGETKTGEPVMAHEPVAIELFYVEVMLRPSAEAMFLRPTTLEIHAPKLPKPNGRGTSTSVHYGDMHIPYHDPRVRSLLFQIIERVQPDAVVDHGDTADCHEISRYEKDLHDRVHLSTEVEMVTRQHGEIHALTPDADHYWITGNHEDRLQRLIRKLADNRAAGEILTLPSVTDALRWDRLTGVADLGWTMVPYPEHILFRDRLILTHGNTVRKHSAYSAKAEYERFGKSGMSGHTHRRGVYEHRDYNGWKAWWELGLTGLIHADYTAFPNWQQGFAVVTWSKDYQHFSVEEIRIHDGVAFFRGEMLEGDPADTLTEAAREARQKMAA